MSDNSDNSDDRERIDVEVPDGQDPAEIIFKTLVDAHGSPRIQQAISATGDSFAVQTDEPLTFVSLAMGGMLACVQALTEEGELPTFVDMDHPWQIVFAASRDEMAGLIDALQAAVDYADQIKEVRQAEPGDFEEDR